MKKQAWLDTLRAPGRKQAMPILSFPSIQLMGITVNELIEKSELQAQGMKMVADRIDAAAAVSMMDLSVEAEAFGSTIRFSDDEVPTVIGGIVASEEDAEALRVPPVGAGRTGRYIEAIGKAKQLITDRPVLAGVIGPFSLAGRLMDVTEALINCYEEPDMVRTTLEKVTEFLIAYIKAYQNVGADGLVLAEPLTGLLSPALAAQFSEPYVKRIVDAVADEDFIFIYHNCGNSAIAIIDSILRTGADAYHFGNAISMKEMLKKIPAGTITMGNVDPALQFRKGTPASIAAETKRIMAECSEYDHFVISSGCDVPPMSPWENIDAFFQAVDEFYG
ncbi:MAG: uroporphyrinogen decarboxylase family protein [Christensenellales bacterium]|jgi:uroporphyrinogen decarboxylase